MTLSPEVLAIAEAQAARDRDTLAELRRSGRVIRSGPRSRFTDDDIEARAWPKRKINLAIRPNKKRRHR